MKPKYKRIIAREGLILIALLSVAGISFFIDLKLKGLKRSYEANVQEIEPVSISDNKAKKYKVQDSKTGKTFTFKWYADKPPTEKDIENIELLKEAGFSDTEIEHHFATASRKFTEHSTGYKGLNVILRFPRNTSPDVITQTIKRDFPGIKSDDWIIFDSPVGQNISASYDVKGNRVFTSIFYNIEWLYISLFFLILAYPLSLLIRFVIWAVKTLREKEVT